MSMKHLIDQLVSSYENLMGSYGNNPQFIPTVAEYAQLVETNKELRKRRDSKIKYEVDAYSAEHKKNPHAHQQFGYAWAYIESLRRFMFENSTLLEEINKTPESEDEANDQDPKKEIIEEFKLLLKGYSIEAEWVDTCDIYVWIQVLHRELLDELKGKDRIYNLPTGWRWETPAKLAYLFGNRSFSSRQGTARMKVLRNLMDMCENNPSAIPRKELMERSKVKDFPQVFDFLNKKIAEISDYKFLIDKDDNYYLYPVNTT